MNPVWWNEMAPGWGRFLVEVGLKSALLIAGSLLADRVLGDRRASWRNLLWHTALVGLILVPLAVAWGPSMRVPVPAKAETIVPSMPRVPAAPVSLPVDAPVSEPAAAVAGAPAEPPAPAWQWPAILVLVYGAGVVFFLGRLGMGLLYVASLRWQAREVRDERLWPVFEELRTRLGIRRPVKLGTSEQVGSPLQVGIFSPVAILPARLLGRLDEQTFRAVAAHELAHVRRWDYLVHLLALVVLAAHWFNPLAWLALRRLHETGEHACDEWAVRLLGRYEVYAGALLDVLGELRGQPVRWGLGMAYQAEQRLERILAMKNALPGGVSRWGGGVMVLGLSAGAVMLGCSALSMGNKPDAGTGSVSLGDTSPGSTPPSGAAFSIPLSGITIDGQLGDWPIDIATCAIAEVSAAYSSAPPPTDLRDFSAHFQSGYDPATHTLYLAVVVEDDELVTHPEAPSVSNQDLCEVYIDADHSGRDRILTNDGFSSAGAQQYVMVAGPGMAFDKVATNPALVGDEAHRSGVQAACRREGTTTTYEWAIPLYTTFPETRFAARAGRTIGFDVAVVDADGGEPGNWISWSPGMGKVFNSDLFGELTWLQSYQELGTLVGVVAEGKNPGAGVLVEVYQGERLVTTMRTDDQGWCRQRLLPGEYTLKGKGGQGFALASAAAVVRAGQETRATLALAPVPLPSILQQMIAAYRGLQTYRDTTTVEQHLVEPGMDHRWTRSMAFALARPNRVWMEKKELAGERMEGMVELGGVRVVSDGVTMVQYLVQAKQYLRGNASAPIDPEAIARFLGVGPPLLLHQLLLSGDPERALVKGLSLDQATVQGEEQLGGVPMVVVELRRTLGGMDLGYGEAGKQATVRLWIGAQDHLLHQVAYEVEEGGGAPNRLAGRRWGFVDRHTGIQVNAAIPAETFTFVPSADDRQVASFELAVEPPASKQLVGKPAPDFVLKNLDGQEIRLADFAGKVRIIDFCATWSSSQVEVPAFIALQSQYGDKGFSVIGLSTGEEAQTVRRFAEKHLINYPLLMADAQVRQDYGKVPSLPTTFVVDKKGVVRYVHLLAPQDLHLFQQQVEELLRE